MKGTFVAELRNLYLRYLFVILSQRRRENLKRIGGSSRRSSKIGVRYSVKVLRSL